MKIDILETLVQEMKLAMLLRDGEVITEKELPDEYMSYLEDIEYVLKVIESIKKNK
jgi:hypothetical protein